MDAVARPPRPAVSTTRDLYKNHPTYCPVTDGGAPYGAAHVRSEGCGREHAIDRNRIRRAAGPSVVAAGVPVADVSPIQHIGLWDLQIFWKCVGSALPRTPGSPHTAPCPDRRLRLGCHIYSSAGQLRLGMHHNANGASKYMIATAGCAVPNIVDPSTRQMKNEKLKTKWLFIYRCCPELCRRLLARVVYLYPCR